MSGGAVLLIGLGPGAQDHVTAAAAAALARAQVVIGYGYYLELVAPLLRPDQERRAFDLGDELARAEAALEAAMGGHQVALISSGDAGLYGMGGPLFQVLEAHGWDGLHPAVEVYPGISAFQAAAARLGAPFAHDFCAISLSDLLTPWPLIEKRVTAAGEADFVVAFYNPRSRERHWQLSRALELLSAHRTPGTPAAVARQVSRPDEHLWVGTLANLPVEQVDMFALVIVGSTQSRHLGAGFYTPRGYQ